MVVNRKVESAPLVMYTIMGHPTDYPQWWVVRKDLVYPDEVRWEEKRLYPSLFRARLPLARMGLYRMARHPENDPVIVETWF